MDASGSERGPVAVDSSDLVASVSARRISYKSAVLMKRDINLCEISGSHSGDYENGELTPCSLVHY
jgi:hypothetical protein